MWLFLTKRALHGLLVVLLVTVTVFVVTHMIADPVRLILPQDASVEQERALRESLGLDRPIIVQLLDYLKGMATLDFQDSYWQHKPVLGLVLERMPATFQLIGVSVLIAVVVFVPLGILASLRAGSVLDRVLSALSMVGLSMPQFWLGAMLILVFAVNLHVLPTSGKGGIEHIVLPATTLAFTIGGRLAMITRATMLEQMARPYIVSAQARGLGTFRIVTRHALPNSLVPILTVVSWETAYGLAGYAVVVETLFAWPGLGQLAMNAIRFRDLNLLQGVVFIAAVVVIVINVVTDILYKRIDPRIALR